MPCQCKDATSEGVSAGTSTDLPPCSTTASHLHIHGSVYYININSAAGQQNITVSGTFHPPAPHSPPTNDRTSHNEAMQPHAHIATEPGDIHNMVGSESTTLDGAKTDSQLQNITASCPTVPKQDLFSHGCTTGLQVDGSVYNPNVKSGAGQQNLKVEGEEVEKEEKVRRCEKCVLTRRASGAGGFPEGDMWGREGAWLTGDVEKGESEPKAAQRLVEGASWQ